MFSLEMLTEAADLVETRDKEKRLMESPSPTPDVRKTPNHIFENEKPNANGKCSKADTSSNESEEFQQSKRLHNGQSNHSSLNAKQPVHTKSVNGHGNIDELKVHKEETLHFESQGGTVPQEQQLDQGREIRRSNGLATAQETNRHREGSPARTHSREIQYQSDRKSPSPPTDRGGDHHPLPKPMVLLQQPSAATLSSVGAIHSVPGANPAFQAGTMHHPYLYSMMYPAAGASLDTLVNRAPVTTHKEGDARPTTPNGSPNALAAAMHLPAGFMYPFSNQALMMGGAAGGLAEISPFLLAQTQAAYASAAGVPANLATLDQQYKRLLEGIPQMPSYHFPPHLMEYFKTMNPQGVEGPKDAATIAALTGRLPHGIPLATLQAQPGASDLWLRYPEHLNPAIGMLRPNDGVSPRSASPYAAKRRSESPAIPNGVKASTSAYPYHGALGQQALSSYAASRVHARSPASIFAHGQRSRSPNADARKAEMERANFRAHSRDVDRDGKPAPRDVGMSRELASTSVATNHNRNTADHHTFSVTDENGRKISIPPHLAHFRGYPVTQHHPVHERSPSPQPLANEDLRAYRRTSRERSPAGDPLANKRRSLDAHYGARQSPAASDRHESKPASPLTNGQPQLSRHHLANGSAETATTHTVLPLGHGSPSVTAFAEAREQRGGSPATNPYLSPGMTPYLAPHLIGGLAGTAGTPLFLPQYAQVLAASAKGGDLTSLAALYKPGEGTPDYSRIPGLPLNMALPLLPQQQLLAAAGRPPTMPTEYELGLRKEYLSSLAAAKDAAKARDAVKPGIQADYALKAREYFTSLASTKESGKSSPVNGREKSTAHSQSIHPSLLHPGPTMSPSNPALKKHSSSPMPYLNVKGASHGIRAPDAHSPPSTVNLGSAGEARRYHSPGSNDRAARETSPKPSAKHYRPNSMLHQHAEDLARNRKLKRKLEDEIAMGDDASNFLQGKQHSQSRPEQRVHPSKDVKKDPKRRKQIIAEGDPDIEEHFRRSLGKDYKLPDTQNKVSITGTVDDHFKKALGGEVWNKLQTTAAVAVKNEPPRDVAAHTAHVLPSYSVAVAGGNGRGYPEGKDHVARMYESQYVPRDRYHVQMSSAPSHHRRSEKSPPDVRSGTSSASTVLYPPNQPTAPARQRVKAKAVVYPETAPALPDIGRSNRAPSLGSKGSTRTISGSSAESLPTVHSKRTPSPASNCSTAVSDATPRGPPPTMAAAPQSIAYSYVVPPHPSTVSSAASTASSRSPASMHGMKPPTSGNSPPAASTDDSTRSPSSRYSGNEAGQSESAGRPSHEDKPST